MPNKHSPTARYGLVLLTSGYYAFFWLLSLMQDVNNILGRQYFKVKGIQLLLVGCLGFYFGCVAYLMLNIGQSTPNFLPWLTLLIGVSLLASLAFLVTRVSQALVDIQPHETHNSSAGMIWLTLFFAASLPILQAKVNSIIDELRRGKE